MLDTSASFWVQIASLSVEGAVEIEIEHEMSCHSWAAFLTFCFG